MSLWAANRGIRPWSALIALALVAWLITPTWAQCEFQKLTASDAEAGDAFGAVAISGDYLIVGAPGDDDACPLDPDCDSGAAYIYRRNNNGTPNDGSDDTWTEQFRLTASDAEAGDWFGFPVDIKGDLALVGAIQDDDGCPEDPDCNSGAVYVFRREGPDWIEEAKLSAAVPVGGALFGRTLSLSGDASVVGALIPASSAGAAYVFRRSGTSWSQEIELVASDAPVINFGFSVAIDGDRAVVGAPEVYDSFFGDPGGAVYAFTYDGSTWKEDAKLTPNDPVDGDSFGESVSIEDDVILIGTLWFIPQGGPGPGQNQEAAGSAYVFRRLAEAWVQETRLRPIDGTFDKDTLTSDAFGISVAVSGETALVGARLNDAAAEKSGAAYLFRRSGELWSERAKLVVSDAAAKDRAGTYVDIDSRYALLSASGKDDVCPQDPDCNSGAAYVYWLLSTEECVPIPATDTWGVLVLGILLANAATVLIARRRYRPGQNRA